MRISNFSSMCHFFLISRGRARQLHLNELSHGTLTGLILQTPKSIFHVTLVEIWNLFELVKYTKAYFPIYALSENIHNILNCKFKHGQTAASLLKKEFVIITGGADLLPNFFQFDISFRYVDDLWHGLTTKQNSF